MGPNPQFPANLVTFTEEILNGKLHFLCSESHTKSSKWSLTLDGEYNDHKRVRETKQSFIEKHQVSK